MYSLRIVEQIRESENDKFERVESNHELGDAYSKISRGTRFFCNAVIAYGMKDECELDFDQFIKGSNGDVFIVRKSEPNHLFYYFVMTENGSTFEKLNSNER